MVMVTLYLKDKFLHVKLENLDNSVFTQCILVLRKNGFRWDKGDSSWRAQYFKYDKVKTALEEFTVLNDVVDPDSLNNLDEGFPEQENEKTRRIPDYSLMNFPPMQGKAPNENFQHLAVTKGINRSRYAYLYGMGTGKSYIAAAIIAHRLIKYHDCGKVVFLTTNIGVRNLYHELFKFIKDLDPNKVKIADKDYRNPFDDKNIDIVVCSYNSFRLISNYYKTKYKIKVKNPRTPFLPLKEWADGKELMLICDESHEVSHPESQRSQLIALHSSLFKYRYLFTGTFADRPEKGYNQYKILDPWLIWNLSYSQWKEKMAELGNRFSASAIREWKKEELEKQNKRFIDRHGEFRETTELVDLPNYNEKHIYLDMSKQHRDIYEEVIMQDIAASETSTRDIVNRFPYMMISVDNPFLLEKHEEKFDAKLNKMIKAFKPNYLEKFLALDDIIEDHPDDKILIWAIHPKTINYLGERYEKLNPICITGATDQNERNALVEEFKHNPEHKLLIANITTLNTSVTITECHVQVYLERGFNFSQYEQSTQRIYRISQEKDVETYILLYNNSLDILLDKNLESKGMLVRGLVSKDFLSQDEWVKIFNCRENDKIDY